MKEVLVAIPARIGSTRLPRKPLIPIGGIPLVVRVARNCGGLKKTDVIVLTDSEEVKKTASSYGIKCEIVRGNFSSGTERIGAFVRKHSNYKIIINVQGDEPLIRRDVISKAVSTFQKNPELEFLTFATELDGEEEWKNPHVVKVVTDRKGWALYFSRAPLPYPRNSDENPPPWRLALKHVGVYGYRRESLLWYVRAKRGRLEQVEMLEQLRILENGRKILVIKTEGPFISVDTPEDVRKVQEFLRKNEK